MNRTAGRDVDKPLISFGGSTTPVGALISSRAARASPLATKGAMSGVDSELKLGRRSVLP